MSRSARQTHAFEPNPSTFGYLSRAHIRRVTAYNVALSDAPSTATLWLPDGDGEASLIRHENRPAVGSVSVQCRTLDSYGLDEVGFIKIDVEGHEQKVLKGARETIERCRPTVYVELEERHQAGAVMGVMNLFSKLDYQGQYFSYEGSWRTIDKYCQRVHQDAVLPLVNSPRYVSNFLFVPDQL
jgi:FkbM family methyltransferase